MPWSLKWVITAHRPKKLAYFILHPLSTFHQHVLVHAIVTKPWCLSALDTHHTISFNVLCLELLRPLFLRVTWNSFLDKLGLEWHGSWNHKTDLFVYLVASLRDSLIICRLRFWRWWFVHFCWLDELDLRMTDWPVFSGDFYGQTLLWFDQQLTFGDCAHQRVQIQLLFST